MTAGDGPAHRRGQRATEFATRKYAGSVAEQLWNQLQAIDFINRALIFAATLLLCLFPFMIVASALAGRSVAAEIAKHVGLNEPASEAVGRLFAPSAVTSHAISGTASAFLFVGGGIAAATAMQELYERVFGLDKRGLRDVLRRLVWLGAFIGLSVLTGWAAPHLHHVGGPVLVGLIGFVLFIVFWWFTIWLLLGGRKSWRELFPPACATAVLWIAMQIFFSFYLSKLVVSENREYGPIGTVFALMTYLIAVGVVVILGAAIGITWRDREMRLMPTLIRRH